MTLVGDHRDDNKLVRGIASWPLGFFPVGS